ncbi:competence/damage-inducible protein A [Rhodohalobacter sp. 8-1]|uniref:competence/damage-inducible protein A n=1 Tax=Rhodohalobacter sp. 8-1 TaxID=3131972 RepID=UPI0030EE0037
MKTAHIISIGNELLIGDTINTNASWLGRYLNEQGFDVEQVMTLPDTYDLLIRRMRESFNEADFTVVTGGLGPTHDDITKKVITDLFNTKLTLDKNVLNHIKKVFEVRGFTFRQSNADQALVPENSSILFNKKGTAPGLWIEENGHVMAVLPGVPHEMRYLAENEITPRLESVFPNRTVRSLRYFHTAGVPESTLSDEVIGDLSEYLSNGLEVAFLPNAGGVKIRVGYRGDNIEQAEAELDKFRSMLLEKAGDVIYGEGKVCNLADVLGELLIKQEKSISVAESCTGGRVSDTITDIPGCSRYMLGGVIAYANSVKTEQLSVKTSDLDQFGAVSAPVALQMAKGVAKRTGADIGVSTTGIAGPGGGTKEKPVGTVWMGFWTEEKHFAIKGIFTDEREINKQRTTSVVLETVRRQLLGIDSYPYNLTPVYS